MKTTNAQREEIDFLCQYYVKGVVVTEEEKLEYIAHSVHGKGKKRSGINSENMLLKAKRNLDIMVKMWREDLVIGLLGVEELKDEFNNNPYLVKLVDGIIKGVTPEGRGKLFEKNRNISTILAVTNFPQLKEKFSEALKNATIKA